MSSNNLIEEACSLRYVNARWLLSHDTFDHYFRCPNLFCRRNQRLVRQTHMPQNVRHPLTTTPLLMATHTKCHWSHQPAFILAFPCMRTYISIKSNQITCHPLCRSHPFIPRGHVCIIFQVLSSRQRPWTENVRAVHPNYITLISFRGAFSRLVTLDVKRGRMLLYSYLSTRIVESALLMPALGILLFIPFTVSY